MKPYRIARVFLYVTAFAALTTQARAEYRAFSLVITNSQTGATRLVTSTLDDIQYPTYYPLRRYENRSIQSTWMCWGRTSDFKPICASPRSAQP